MANFIELEAIDQWNEISRGISESKSPILLDFSAAYCGPCKMILPKLKKFAEIYKNVIFLKVDVDEFKQISSDFKITCMPTIIIIHNNTIVKRIEGADISAIQSELDKF